MTPPPAERGELEAFRSLLEGARGAHVHELGGALCTALEELPRSALFNRVLGLGHGRPATEETLDEIAAFFKSVGVTYAITVAPGAAPWELPQLLERRGFTRGYAWTKFTRTPAPPPDARSELRIAQVGAEAGPAFADVFTRAYGSPAILRPTLERLTALPGWHCFLAYAQETPAAAAALYVTGDIGWFGVAGTLPELRGRGAQAALLAARIEAARASGCTVLVTETGEPRGGRPGASYRNILRAGFEPAYVRQNYLSLPDADTSGTTA
jgi:GNAT superfamily N-acetyltransferase